MSVVRIRFQRNEMELAMITISGSPLAVLALDQALEDHDQREFKHAQFLTC